MHARVHATLDLRVVSLSPTLGIEITLKKVLKKKMLFQDGSYERIVVGEVEVVEVEEKFLIHCCL